MLESGCVREAELRRKKEIKEETDKQEIAIQTDIEKD